MQCVATGLGVADGARALKPFQNSPAEWPIVLGVLALSAIVVTLYAGCHLDTHVQGHRIDQAPVIVVTPSKPDDQDSGR